LKGKWNIDAEITEFARRDSFVIVANICLLVLYGKPKLEESLVAAWERCLSSSAWQSRPEEYGGFNACGREAGTPFDFCGSGHVAEYFRKYFLPDLPGTDKIGKLSSIFETAPPWLLWFTHGDFCARILGIRVPDLSSVNRFARGEFLLDYLPTGPFKRKRLPAGVYDIYEGRAPKGGSEDFENMTPRQKQRAMKIKRIQAGES
jgi:hypothetical protein